MPDQANIRTLLAEADSALEQGELNSAEQLYRQASDAAAPIDLELFDQALDGLLKVKERRQSRGTLTAILAPELPKAEGLLTSAAPDDQPEAGMLDSAGASGPGDRSDAATVDGEDADDRPDVALPAPPSASPTSDSPSRSARTAKLDPELPAIASPALPATPAEPVAPRLPPSDPAARTAPGAAGNVDLADTTQSILKRIEELEAEADGYLRQPTNNNYKSARDLLDRILSYNVLAPERRRYFEQRREKIERDREAFLARFGALLTARQIANDTDELIELRKLQVDGHTIDPDGKSLDDRFLELRDRLIDKLIRSASERSDAAEEAIAEGLDYLEEQQISLAIQNLQEAIQILEGRDVHPSEPADQTPGTERQSTSNSVRYIKSNLQENRRMADAIVQYRKRGAEAEKLRRQIGRIRPLFDQAYTAYQQGDYAGATAQVAEVQELFGKDVTSERLNTLLHLAQQRWEREVLVRATALLDRARTELSRGDEESAMTCLGQVLELEPGLATPGIERQRDEARALQNEVRATWEDLRTQLEQARLMLTRGDFGAARQKISQVLMRKPQHAEALQLRDQLIASQSRQSLRQAESLLVAGTVEELSAGKSAVEAQRSELADIHEQLLQQRIRREIDDLSIRLDERIQEKIAYAQVTTDVRRLLDNARMLLVSETFEEAQASLAAARKLLPDNAIELRRECEALETQMRADWIDSLRQRARQQMSSSPPDPRAALACLQQLERLATQPDLEMDRIAQRAREMLAREDGLKAFQRGEYEDAVKLLIQASPADPDVLTALREARRRIGDRLIQMQRWAAAVEILEQTGLETPETVALIRQARFGLALQLAQSARAAYQFDEAKQRLDEATALTISGRPPTSDATAQVEAEHRLLEEARTRFGAAKETQARAQALYQTYQRSGGRTDLYNAVRELDKTIDLLPSGDQQRIEIENMRRQYAQMYETIARDAYQDAIKRARQHFDNRDFAAALAACREAESIGLGGTESEIRDLLARTREAVRTQRIELVKRVRDLLSSRRVTSERVAELLQQIEVARAWDEQNDDGLRQAEHDLREARSVIARADQELATARQHWAVARRQGGDFRLAHHAIEQALRHFANLPYLHEQLNQGSDQSLALRINDDQRAIEEANRLRDLLLGGLASTDLPDLAGVRADLERLQHHEEQILKETDRLLQDLPGETRPATNRERYPRQYQVLQALVQRINLLARRLRGDENATLSDLQQYNRLIDLLHKSDPADRLELRGSVDQL